MWTDNPPQQQGMHPQPHYSAAPSAHWSNNRQTQPNYRGRFNGNRGNRGNCRNYQQPKRLPNTKEDFQFVKNLSTTASDRNLQATKDLLNSTYTERIASRGRNNLPVEGPSGAVTPIIASNILAAAAATPVAAPAIPAVAAGIPVAM